METNKAVHAQLTSAQRQIRRPMHAPGLSRRPDRGVDQTSSEDHSGTRSCRQDGTRGTEQVQCCSRCFVSRSAAGVQARLCETGGGSVVDHSNGAASRGKTDGAPRTHATGLAEEVVGTCLVEDTLLVLLHIRTRSDYTCARVGDLSKGTSETCSAHRIEGGHVHKDAPTWLRMMLL